MGRHATVLTALLVLAPGLAAAQQADWPQFDFDPQHSGATDQETTIHPGNVSTLHVLYHVALPAIADGAPAFLPGVSTAGGVKDLLFLTTKDGRILALDAANGATVWSKQPATGPSFTTSSPAIDPDRQYVYSYGLEGRVHKYAVGDGSEVTSGGWPATTTLKPSVEKGSSALATATAQDGTTYLYAANGGYPGDAGDYQGHVTAIDLATGVQKVFNADCSDQTVHFVTGGGIPDCSAVQTAIWARPGVVYDPSLDLIFMATGNGTYDANGGGHNWGDSVFALHPDATGSGGLPVDAYTPTEFQQLQNLDLDLGSTAPAILPAPAGSSVAHLAVQTGKDAKVRLLNLANLSGMGGPGHVSGELQKLDLPQGGGVLTMPAVWVDPISGNPWAFIANSSGITGYELTLSAGTPSLTARWTNAVRGTSPVVANGMVFYASSSGMKALDPKTGASLWTDASLGSLHWQSPIVTGGRLFVVDQTPMLWAYGPNPEPLSFFTLDPCRLIDTRQPAGPLGGPALAGNGAKRTFPVAGHCGVPAGARAVAANVTIVVPSAAGDLRLGPVGLGNRTTTINFRPGQVRANNAVLSLTGNPLGEITVQTDISPGTTHLVVDVSGYFL
jgi:hypothetical protein